MPNRCETKHSHLFCWVIGFQVLVFVTIGLALLVRFRVYNVKEVIDLPSDQRVIHLRHSSAFCENYIVTSKIANNNGLSNTDPHFDLYGVKTQPNEAFNTTSKNSSLRGTYGLKGGDAKTYTMNLLNGSMTSFRVCAADAAYDDYVTMTPPKSVMYCITRGRSPPKHSGSKFCDDGVGKGKILLGLCTATQPINFNASTNGDYSITIWNHMNNDSAAFQIHFSIKRLVYVIPEEFSKAKHSTEYKTSPKMFFIVEFNYHGEEKTEHYLDQILLECSCTPRVSVYIGIFFGLPFAILIVVSIICLSRYNHNNYDAM